ncbi:uncharacterized protein [Miscanthus floridulus]|uniref:uncharacterized protein isoform X2 n=1 Tax=Miscanthus floridulus TaxID=154761 RepID=UPI003457AC5A
MLGGRKEEGLDGGIVEDEKLSAGNADIGSGSLASKHEEKFDKNSGSNLVEVYVHDLAQRPSAWREEDGGKKRRSANALPGDGDGVGCNKRFRAAVRWAALHRDPRHGAPLTACNVMWPLASPGHRRVTLR